MAASKDVSRKLLKSLIFELRQINQKPNVKDLPAYQHIFEQFRRFQVTDEKICRGRQEMLNLGQTYLCYLHSSRRRNELHEEFHGHDISVEEAARLVGLRLPQQYNDTTDKDK